MLVRLDLFEFVCVQVRVLILLCPLVLTELRPKQIMLVMHLSPRGKQVLKDDGVFTESWGGWGRFHQPISPILWESNNSSSPLFYWCELKDFDGDVIWTMD